VRWYGRKLVRLLVNNLSKGSLLRVTLLDSTA